MINPELYHNNINLLLRNSKEFYNAYDLVTIGMRIAYMDSEGLIDIDTTTFGEEDITEFALELSKGWDKYVQKKEEDDTIYSWDWYIEEAILAKYGREKAQ